ncbi:MAG: hypothetical protein R2828_00950 [Saprospiraceae bacterium]
MKKFFFLVGLLLCISIFQSCEKDTNNKPTEEVAPTLPLQETFVMPFTGYEDIDTTGLTSTITIDERSGPTGFRNWFYAGSNVLVWNVILGVNMAIPVASFAEAFNHDPAYIGDGVFLWTYNFNLGGETFIASLTGEFVNNNLDVQWIMNISMVGGFSNVEWYRGIVSRDNKTATWTLNHRPENPTPFIRIDYQKNDVTGEFSIQYTNIIPGNADFGNYIAYRIQVGQTFNRAYDIFRGSDDDFLEIEWNVPSGEGRVRNPAAYNDNEWHCWDTEKKDTDC